MPAHVSIGRCGARVDNVLYNSSMDNVAVAVVPPRKKAPARARWRLPAVIAGVLLALMLLQLPVIADWSSFAFYDPGTALKGDLLICMGFKPAVDFGYTHGLATLLFARAGFWLLGRTPWAFLIMTALLEICMALAIAAFARAMHIRGAARIFLFCALPLAVMPVYLTLTHPLEALLIMWAIAEQACGRRPRALAICTACLFVKPSMAYVYGFLLTVWTLWDWRHSGGGIADLFKRTWLATATAMVATVVTLLAFGPVSLARTIVPLTGMKTYHDTHFGFFAASGFAFWSPFIHGILYYFITPAGSYLACALATAAVGALLLARRRRGLPSRRTQTLLSMAIMLGAFLFGFYGWPNSWQYYSYLPALFVAAALATAPRARPCIIAASVLVVLGQATNAGIAIGAWVVKARYQQTGGLWVYPRQYAAWKRVLAVTAGQPTLVMSNGYLPWMPPGMVMPLSWFPEPGIPTKIELRRVAKQALRAKYVVTWNAYGKMSLWNQRDFAAVRSRFFLLKKEKYFCVWRQRPAVGQAPSTR